MGRAFHHLTVYLFCKGFSSIFHTTDDGSLSQNLGVSHIMPTSLLTSDPLNPAI